MAKRTSRSTTTRSRKAVEEKVEQPVEELVVPTVEDEQPVAEKAPSVVPSTVTNNKQSTYPDNVAVLIIEQPDFDQFTGKRNSVEYPVTYNQGDLAQFAKHGRNLGYVVRKIEHIPEGWNDYGIEATPFQGN